MLLYASRVTAALRPVTHTDRHVHQGVWDVVCLAAIAAIDSGRRLIRQRQQPAAGSPAAAAAAAAGPGLAAAAGLHAVARLWVLLQDFCSVGTAPAAWQQEVPAEHPFMCWQPGAQRWQLVRSDA